MCDFISETMLENYHCCTIVYYVEKSSHPLHSINPQCTCAVQVTVVGFVCLSVSLSHNQHVTSGMSNCATHKCTYSVAYECQHNHLCGYVRNDHVQELWCGARSKRPIANNYGLPRVTFPCWLSKGPESLAQ